MLQNQISNQTKTILFVDKYGLQKYAEPILKSLLGQQNTLEKQKYVILNAFDTTEKILEKSVSDIIVIPQILDILLTNRPAELFNVLNKLKKSKNVKQIFLWVSNDCIREQFAVAYMEYMADQIITFKDKNLLTILTRKSGGLVSNKKFNYRHSTNEILIEPVKLNTSGHLPAKEKNLKTDSKGTFKIELEEEEMVARNALKLPYEKVKENEGNIIYTPDEADDFDDEDPDEDLSI